MTKDKIDSPVLKSNIRKLLSAMDIEEGEESPIRLLNASYKNLNNFPELGIYDHKFLEIVSVFSIPEETTVAMKSALERSASLYLKLYSNRKKSVFYKDHMARLKQISKYANLLKNEITNADQKFLEFLDVANQYEVKDENEPTIYEFINSARRNLEILVSLENNVKKGRFGEQLGIGTPGRKKDIALDLWVGLHYGIWTDILKRTMTRDKTGVGGRKKFLEYLDHLMAPLHPEVCSHNIDLSKVRDNPITNDKIATALKNIQKDIKLRGEYDL